MHFGSESAVPVSPSLFQETTYSHPTSATHQHQPIFGAASVHFIKKSGHNSGSERAVPPLARASKKSNTLSLTLPSAVQ